jgi:hypothetical protein
VLKQDEYTAVSLKVSLTVVAGAISRLGRSR